MEKNLKDSNQFKKPNLSRRKNIFYCLRKLTPESLSGPGEPQSSNGKRRYLGNKKSLR